jgi:class 3 adenylate cyclase
MKLGIGIVAGRIIEIDMKVGSYDFVGSNVNLSARLCNIARPEGIVICTDSRICSNEKIYNSISELLKEDFNMFNDDIAEDLKGIEYSELKISKIEKL